MRVREVELRRVRMPLVRPFRTAHGVERERDVLVLRIATDGADGWSECVAPNAPTYTSEWVGGAHAVIRDFLAPILVASPVTASEVTSRLAGIEGHAMAKAAIETAMLDAQLRNEGRSLASFLGATRARVECGVAVGIAASIADLVDECEGYLAAGYRRVKLKIRPGWDVEPVAAFRKQFGDVPLQVDANGAYTLRDTATLGALDEFHLLCIEQPLPADQVREHTALSKVIATPICLDESISSVHAAREAIRLGACSVICVKPGRLGGYLAALETVVVGGKSRVALWCGGMLETGLGRAANLALAAHPGFTMIGDLSASDRYFARDLTEPLVMEHGELRVPDGPGVGAVPDPDALRELTTSIEVVTRA